MTHLYVGLMSGTSLDAVDAALMDFSNPRRPRLLNAVAHPLEPDLRDTLLRLTTGTQALTLPLFGELDQRVGALFAEAALALMARADVSPDRIQAIGSHGQTLHHAPDAVHPYSLQIGDPSLIAAHTGITTVADFRQRDIALGGQGAPLVPAFHHDLFRSESEHRCVVNIGGIANVTVLRRDDERVIGFDTGPGNALMDYWAEAHLGIRYDEDGRWAASSAPDQDLLQVLLGDPFFQRPPPKSTGREYFHAEWLQHQFGKLGREPAAPRVQRTLCALTAQSIATAIKRFGPGEGRVLLCGGGARNPTLRADLTEALAPATVTDTGEYGLAPEWVEACAFAWLAMRTLAGLPGNLPSVTGAREAAVLGGIYVGRRQR